MRSPKAYLIAAAVSAFAAAPALAQQAAPLNTVPEVPSVGAPHAGVGGVNPVLGAPDSYGGAPKAAFYSVEARISGLEARAKSMNGPAASQARAQIVAIKSFEATQRARHGGELRDWDREAITARLNRVEALLGG